MTDNSLDWRKKIVEPEVVLDKIHPGMSIFLTTGAAEPRTMVKHLLAAQKGNLTDLELIQLISFGEAIAIDERYYQSYRLKTFFSGWVAHEAITSGRVDLIPCRLSRLPELIASGAIQVDAAFIQITPPDEAGYVSLGLSVDVARQAIERSSLVVGEINEMVPRTLGDSFLHVRDFHYLVKSEDPPLFLPRWPLDETYDKVAQNVAAIIEDGNCLGFAFGPIFEGLARHLTRKKNLGIHGFIMTDALMDLIKSGAINNRRKEVFRGKSVVAYGMGTPELLCWLHNNPVVEFQGIDKVSDPRLMGANDHFTAILPARKVDLTGNVALPMGKGNVTASLGGTQESLMAVAYSKGGRAIFTLPSRNLTGQSNILVSLGKLPNQLAIGESIDFVVTEYGAAHLTGRSVRDRALALIDIAHPDERAALVAQAKEAHLLYRDQIYLVEGGHHYPEELSTTCTFKEGLEVRFRAIKPSDEEEMRRLFYRFSSEAVYYRFFSPIKAMPHARLQEYVNVDYCKIISIVGLVGPVGTGRIISEARYVCLPDRLYADTAFVVDEEYQSRGIATYMLNMLIKVARGRGLKGITADVLPTNKAMWKVYEKTPYPLKAERESDSYHLTITFVDK